MRIGIVLIVKNLGAWGSGKEEFEADTLTMRTTLPALGESVVTIPGSYMKGLLRGWAYKIAPLLKKTGVIRGDTNEECYVGRTCGKCIVCRVFGSRGKEFSPLHVSNFYPIVTTEKAHEIFAKSIELALMEKDYWAPPPTNYVTRVRISDIDGRAAEGGLYTIEHVSPEVPFYGEITLYESLLKDVDPLEAYRLVACTLGQLNYSYVGRRTRCRVKVVDVEDRRVLKDEIVRMILVNLGVKI